jgi:multidrug transporter EmrE-like cation transporter
MVGSYALLAIAVVFNGAANVLMKAGMRNSPHFTGVSSMIRHYIHSWPVIIGLFLFGFNVIAYTQALAKIPLTIAYPIMVSLTGVIVISSSMYWFKESISPQHWLGLALILGGVVCVVR